MFIPHPRMMLRLDVNSHREQRWLGLGVGRPEAHAWKFDEGMPRNVTSERPSCLKRTGGQ